MDWIQQHIKPETSVFGLYPPPQKKKIEFHLIIKDAFDIYLSPAGNPKQWTLKTALKTGKQIACRAYLDCLLEKGGSSHGYSSWEHTPSSTHMQETSNRVGGGTTSSWDR